MPTSPITTSNEVSVLQIVDAIRSRRRFVISSHARPDGDSIGSQLAMAFALRALGKEVRIVNADPAPGPLMALPGRIRHRDRGSRRRRLRGRDHHGVRRSGADRRRRAGSVLRHQHRSSSGNAGYGQINWFDASAAACGEMVFDLVGALGVPLSPEIATTSMSRSSPTPDRSTIPASRRAPSTSAATALVAGVDPVLIARNVYDSNNMGRLKLFGAVLSAMQLDTTGRIAIVYLDHEMARAAGGTYEDTEGLINLPLTVKEIQAVVFFKQSRGRRVPRQPALQGRHRHRRRRQGVRRRRPQERGGMHGDRRHRRRCRSCSSRREDGAETGAAGWAPFEFMDGVLSSSRLKPAGPTSHDVVARVRRARR